MRSDEPRVGFDRWDAGICVAFTVGLVVLHVSMRAGLYNDAGIYALMAKDPLGAVPPAPFRFRVGAPLLAAYLPFSPQTNFVLVSGAALAATAMIVRRTAHHLAGRARGLAAMALFAGSGVVLLALRLPYLTEPLAMCAGAGALELGRRRRWLAAGLVLAAGAGVRETTLFLLLPLGAWCLASVATRSDRVRALASLGLPGVAVYLVLHKTPLLYGSVQGEHVQSPAEILAWNLQTPGGFGRYLVTVILGSLGLMWLYVPSAMRSTNRYLSCSMLLLVPLLVGTVIASDWFRILGYAVIVAAPATAVVAPARVLRLLVPAQVAVAVAIYHDLPWVALVVAALFVGVAAATGGLQGASEEVPADPDRAPSLTS